MVALKSWFSLEAVYAGKGDALLLHYGARTRPRWMLIDGGHRDVYDHCLRPRLEELRLSHPRRLDGQGRLPLELIMVSHADEDHLLGLLDLTSNMIGGGAPVTVEQLWFNGFSDLIANQDSAAATSLLDGIAQSASANAEPLALPPEIHHDRETRAVIASTAQGRQLLKDAKRLAMTVNEDFKGDLVMRGGAHSSQVKFDPGALSMTVLGPDKRRIDKLRARWKRDLKKILAKEKAAADAASFKDQSPFNLSSIMVLVQRASRTMLLTGDARGDHLVEGLAAENLLDSKGKIRVDLFKLPHHGSDRNVKLETFRDITADHYLISANGEYGNPEPATLAMLAEGRKLTRKDKYKVYLTFPEAAFKLIPDDLAKKKKKVRKQKDALEALDLWIRKDKPANMEMVYRDADRFSLSIDFGLKVFD